MDWRDPPTREADIVDTLGTDLLAHLVGDNSTVIGWINGEMMCTKPVFQEIVGQAHNNLHDAHQLWQAHPSLKGTPWTHLLIREGNKAADSAAGRAIERKVSSVRIFAHHVLPITLNPPTLVLLL